MRFYTGVLGWWEMWFSHARKVFSTITAVCAIDMRWIEGEDGVCIGGQVSISCTVTERASLQWALEPLFNKSDRVDFNAVEGVPGTVLSDPIPDVINITLISVERKSPNSQRGNLTSLITVKVTHNTIGKHVHCSNGYISLEESPSLIIRNLCELTKCNRLYFKNILSIAIPLRPILVDYSVTYAIAKYSAILEWDQDKNDTDFKNYTLILRGGSDNHHLLCMYMDRHCVISNLSYCTNYSVDIYGANCGGTGPSLTYSFMEGGSNFCTRLII